MIRVLCFAILCSVASVRADTLSFAGLKADERIVIRFASVGCFHSYDHTYIVVGGDSPLFIARTNRSGDEPWHDVNAQKELSRAELIGLDAFFLFYRRRNEGSCTTKDRIAVTYHRRGVQIGEEVFVDATCFADMFRDDSGRVRYENGDIPDFQLPIEVIKEMVPLHIIVARLKKQPNQSPEPTPGSVTPRAREPRSE